MTSAFSMLVNGILTCFTICLELFWCIFTCRMNSFCSNHATQTFYFWRNLKEMESYWRCKTNTIEKNEDHDKTFSIWYNFFYKKLKVFPWYRSKIRLTVIPTALIPPKSQQMETMWKLDNGLSHLLHLLRIVILYFIYVLNIWRSMRK